MKLLSILQVIRHERLPKESINLHYDAKRVVHGEHTEPLAGRGAAPLFSEEIQGCIFFFFFLLWLQFSTFEAPTAPQSHFSSR